MSGMTALEVQETLSGIVGAMAADSYDLRLVRAGDDALEFAIEALDGACEDCLAPASVMTGVISSALGGRYRPDQIRIAYP